MRANPSAHTDSDGGSSPGRSAKGLVIQSITIVVALLTVGLLTIQGSQAAFSATTDNGSNTFAAGTVVLADDDDEAVMFEMTGMVPGTTATRCINVTYTGTVTSDVKLYGTVAGNGLADHLTTVIDVGTSAVGGSTFDCTGFTRSSNLHTDTLTAFGSTNRDYGTGLAGFNGATNPSTRSYRVQVTLADSNAAQGLTASATLTWEARNV